MGSAGKRSSRLNPSLFDLGLGAVFFYALACSVWWFPASSWLETTPHVWLLPPLLTLLWVAWQPRVSAGGDQSNPQAPDFRGCLEYERVQKLKGRFLSLFVLGALLLAALYSAQVAPLVSLVLAALFLWSIRQVLRDDPNSAPRIIPVFRPQAPSSKGTFLRGYALARNFERLEKIALTNEVTPLSTFGFACALHGESMVWHPAAQAVATVELLLGEITDEADLELRRDLEALLGGFASAAQQHAEFALLVRCSNFTSSLEWERIGGHPC